MKFVHKVSKGSRFNQIYVPKEMEKEFEAGDLVEVRLLEKKAKLYFYNIKRINKFKEKLIREIFSFLSCFNEIKQVFAVGSFLTQKEDYNDIDLLIITKENSEEKNYNELINKFELRFHIIIIPEGRFLNLKKTCPLTRSMLYHNISNREFKSEKSKVDVKHIKFLLMMPEDLLKVKARSRAFYDSIRRLITIEKFLEDKEKSPLIINKEMEQIAGRDICLLIKNNEEVDRRILEKLREIIKIKLRDIKTILEKK